MSREVRMVPANWVHPQGRNGRTYKPLWDGDYQKDFAEYMKAVAESGEEQAEYDYGSCPEESDYMPQWKDEEKTHYMMYETTSEGTPISPAFATPEDLASYLSSSGASSFGRQTASYEAWLKTIKSGLALSAIFTPQTGLISGVEANTLLGE